MACGNEDCQYWRWCKVHTKEVIDRWTCADFAHLDDIAQDAKNDRYDEDYGDFEEEEDE